MLFPPGSPQYVSATTPHNSSVEQQPAMVAAPTSAEEVSEAVTEATRRGLLVVPQATGHGAGRPVGDDVLLLDTSGLATVEVDRESGAATVGAGAAWSAVNAAAERSGLLGLAGSAPSVAVAGYTFGGGIGWLARRDGLASAALRSVEYVDGAGGTRLAADDAADDLDREAVLAFRGGGGVGVATALHVDLAPVTALHCGRLLWPVAALDDVVGAWAEALPHLGASVATSIGALHVPPEGPFPPELLGRVVVHLAVADPDGADGAAGLLDAVRGAVAPTADDWGPGDAARLAQIHLDPPTAVAAHGDARWLDESTPDLAARLLGTAAADESAVVMMEIRHVAGPSPRRQGALVDPVGPFVYHAVGALGRAERGAIDDAFAEARSVWSAADAGSTPASWVEGADTVSDGLDPATLERVRSVADRVDPDHRIARPRVLGA